MPHWLIKSAIHRTISYLPRPQLWNDLFRKFGSGSLELSPSQFETKLLECNRHWQSFISHRHAAATDFSAFELGTGWFPIIPIGLYLCGAREIWTVDIDPFLRKDRMQQMLGYFKDYVRTGKLNECLPEVRPDRIERLLRLADSASSTAPAEWLREFHIHALVRDAQKLPLPDQSVDWFFSSGVLEYIPEPILKNILTEFRRVAKRGAVMTHRLNLVDVYSYFDKNISTLNHLKFTAQKWRWLNSPLIWQSRLRVSDYRRLYNEAGFKVVAEDNVSEAPEKLDQLTLAPEFSKYDRRDLIVIHSFMVGRLPVENISVQSTP